jgi:hypothetical protein
MYPPASGPKSAPARFRLVARLHGSSQPALLPLRGFIPKIKTAEGAYSGGGADADKASLAFLGFVFC